MKAAVLKEFGAPLSIEEVPDPEPGPDDTIVRVHACGIDGTDLKLLQGFGYTPDLPFIMGHEPAGVVEAVGERVTDFKPGDRVVTYIFLIPPTSPWFQTAREQLAPDMEGVVGILGHAGGYAERLKVAARQLVRVPDGLQLRDAAAHCDAGLTAFHAVSRARLSVGETVLVIGVGGVGSFAVQFAALAGCRVIAAERTEEKRDWARSFGVADVVDSNDLTAAVRKATDGRGVDCVLDIVGIEATMAAAVKSVARGGRIVIVGYTPDTFSIAGKHLAQNEIEVIGTRAGPRTDLSAALKLSASGKVRAIVTDRAPLSQVNEAHALLRSGGVSGRLVLDIGG